MSAMRKAVAMALFTVAFSLSASETMDGVVKLTAKGLAEEVVLAWAGTRHDFEPSVANIVALKEAKVSDNVILALIKAAEAPADQTAPPVPRRDADGDLVALPPGAQMPPAPNAEAPAPTQVFYGVNAAPAYAAEPPVTCGYNYVYPSADYCAYPCYPYSPCVSYYSCSPYLSCGLGYGGWRGGRHRHYEHRPGAHGSGGLGFPSTGRGPLASAPHSVWNAGKSVFSGRPSASSGHSAFSSGRSAAFGRGAVSNGRSAVASGRSTLSSGRSIASSFGGFSSGGRGRR